MITVIHADNFYQTRIRHKGDPFNVDIVLVFNASYHHVHYITTVRTNGENFTLGIPEKDDDYDRSVELSREGKENLTGKMKVNRS